MSWTSLLTGQQAVYNNDGSRIDVGGAAAAAAQPMKFLPQANFVSLGPAKRTSTAPASRAALNSSARAPSERVKTLAAENAPIPVSYGRDLFGSRRVNVLAHAGYWVAQDLWSEGPIDGIEAVLFGADPMPAGVQVQHYTGAPGQGVDPWLAAAFAAKGVTFTDTLPGIAYSVFRIPASVETWDSVSALRRGRLVYDPRSGLTAYSQNPALWLADFLVNTTYGAGRSVNWASVATAADHCDELVGGVARRSGGGITLDAVQPVEGWIEVLRTYAGCLRPVMDGDGAWRLVPDRPAATVASYSHAAGNVQAVSPLRRRGRTEAPTVMRVLWTDTTVTPWAERTAVAQLPGVSTGTVPRREQEVRLAGLHIYSQAVREATERLNKFTLADLSLEVDLFGAAVAHQPGDVIELTYPMGLTAKPLRVLEASGGMGRYRLACAEYDPAVYSDLVQTEPSFADTTLPNPADPTPPTAVVLVEEVYEKQNGTRSSRLFVSWTAPAGFPAGFIDSYRVNVLSGGQLIDTGTARGLEYRTGEVQELVDYQVDVITVSRAGSASSAASAVITAQGKLLPPGNVPALDGFEVGGQVRLRWAAALDIDIWRYEIRYGAVAGSWDDGLLIDRVDALTLVTTVVPVGEWDLMVKALDSVGNYSPVEARRTLTVTLDDGAYLADTYDYDTPALTAMHEYRLGRLDETRRFVTSSAVSWNTAFASAMNTYASPVLSYFAATSAFVTESHDYGLMLAGNWQSELTISDLSGTHTRQMELSADGSSWDDYPSLVAKTSARFSRLRADTTGVMLVELPLARTRIDAIPRTESGSGTSAASGGTTVTLGNEYAAAKSIGVTPMGAAARIAVVDNVVMGSPSSFDVYIFDAAGAQVAGGFMWDFEGV